MTSKKEIEKLAEGLVEVSGQTSIPINLSLIANLESPPLKFYGHKFSGDFDGTLRNFNGNYIILFNSKYGNEHDPRVRFTIAHELGHYFIDEHRQLYATGFKHNSKIDLNSSNERELQANQFSASLLMPKSLFEPLVIDSYPGWDTLQKLALLANTSLISTAIRYIEFTDHPCVLVAIEDRKVTWFKPSKELKKLNVFLEMGLVPQYTHAYGATQGSTPLDGWDDVDASIWLTVSGRKPRVPIKEWTYKHPYGLILTLLWDKKGALDRWEETGYKNDDVEWKPTFHKSRRK